MKRILLAAALVSAGSALAVEKGGTLYIKSKDTQLLKDPKVGSKPVTKLQPGDEVTWNGPSDKDKTLHDVVAKGNKKGFVLQSNLTPNKPATEYDASTGKAMDTKAIASSSAATKALTPAGINYANGQEKPEDKEKALAAAADIIYTEEHNKAKAPESVVMAKSAALQGGKK